MSEIIQDSIFIKDEIPLIGNTYVATLRNLYNIYTVSFDVKPTAFYDFWTNVIHLTNDVHFHFYGGNNLAVMFSFLSKGSLGIWSTINSTIFYKKQLPLMEWSSINISQVLVNESYIYSVFLNGTVVFSSANMASVTLSNVKVYTADPWYAAQSGFIRNLIVNTHVALSEWSVWSSCNTSCGMSTMVRTRICSTTATNCTSVERINCSVLCVVNWNEWADWVTCNLSAGIKFMNRSRVCSSKNIFEWCPGSSTETIECFENNTCDSLFVSTQMDIRVDRTLKVFKNLFKEFSVSFEVNPSHSNNLTNDWLNILHLTLGKNIERYGDRVPGIWLNPTSGTLYISSAVQGEIDYSVTIESLNLFAQWTNVTVLQELVNGNYWFEIYVNGTLNYSVQNTDAREFHAITVFVSDPWHLSLPGFIRNLRILTGINGTRSEWGEWSSCSTKCGIGFIRRTQVFCMSNMEDISETMSCFSNESCQANWAKWSDWSNCNESFGIGLNNRSRICNKTSSYEWCSGNSTEVLVCFNDETCKGIWSQWSNWSQCNVACGIGSIIRVRDCNSTNLCCYGSKSETIDCYNNCQGEWTAWSDCTQTCGFNSYKVSYLWNWLVAPIEYKRVENCILQDCPVDGMWGAWENYGPCSKTCGSDGLRSRKRYCNNPPPANNGDYCKGLNETLEDCEMDTICPVNGGWSEWSFWSLCSQPCLNSERRRVRECMNSTPRYGGRYCEGNDTEIIRCPLKICKSALLSMQMILTNEDFKEQYSNLSSEVSVKFKERIKRTMTNFYGMRNKMLHLDFTFHSITNGSGY